MPGNGHVRFGERCGEPYSLQGGPRAPRLLYVILLPEGEDRWLDPDMTEPEEIVSLLRPCPAELLQAMPAIA